MILPDKDALCEGLARAQGWKQYPLVPGDGSVWMGPDETPARVPDPFTRTDDLLALLEWVVRQPWFGVIRIGNRGTAVGRVFPREEFAAEGPFMEAFPLAVHLALTERGSID